MGSKRGDVGRPASLPATYQDGVIALSLYVFNGSKFDAIHGSNLDTKQHYVHLEVDEQAPVDEADETSCMEWGTYSRDEGTGQLTVTQVFDANGDTGLNDAALGLTNLFAQVSGDTLTLEFSDKSDIQGGSNYMDRAN